MEGNIYIFDSLFLSLGSGQYVIKASHLIEEGNLNASEIIQELENMRKDVNLLFVPFTLEYLKQSGRLPSVVSFVGNMLSIKPICTMEDGKNKIVSKVRGTKQIASKLVDMILELNDGNVEDKIIKISLPNKYKKANNEKILDIAIDKMYEQIAKVEIERAMEKTRILLGFAPEDYEIKNIGNELGRCEDDKITINPNVVKYNRNMIDYVVLHEYCHLKYKTHCKNFNDIMEEKFENYIKIESELSGYKF